MNPISVSADSPEAALWLSRHALPLGLKFKSENHPSEPTRRATFTLLRLKNRHVFVTCAHVFDQFAEMQLGDSTAEIVAYLAPAPRIVELHGFQLIAKERPMLDVAIFGGQEDEIKLPWMRFIDYESDYLSDPQVGEAVVIVGYPAANVSIVPGMADFGYMHLHLPISSISDRMICLANESGQRRFEDYSEIPRDRIELGGLSGSPAFVIRDQRARFVGIVTDCSPEDQTILVSRLGCINADGTLDHSALPWSFT